MQPRAQPNQNDSSEKKKVARRAQPGLLTFIVSKRSTEAPLKFSRLARAFFFFFFLLPSAKVGARSGDLLLQVSMGNREVRRIRKSVEKKFQAAREPRDSLGDPTFSYLLIDGL